jgi:hypothetical protein
MSMIRRRARRMRWANRTGTDERNGERSHGCGAVDHRVLLKGYVSDERGDPPEARRLVRLFAELTEEHAWAKSEPRLTPRRERRVSGPSQGFLWEG